MTPRIAVAAPRPPTPDDEAWGLLVAPWLAEAMLRDGWDRGAPSEVDHILIPYTFGARSASPFAEREAMQRFLALLPEFAVAPAQHVLLDNTDLDTPADDLGGAALFKTSAHVRHASVLSLPYCLLDPGTPAPVHAAELDFAFQGNLDTHPIRHAMNKWHYSWKGWTTEIVPTARPFWALEAAQRAALTRSYASQMRRTRFVLCPRGRALNSRRFYEALAYGRVPVLITDAARLPLESRIDYARFVITVPEGYGRWAPDYAADFLRRNDLERACALARQTWEEWFAPARFRRFIEASLVDTPTLRARAGGCDDVTVR
jgi:hypothetical protein